MNASVIQAIAVSAIVAIGFFVFSRYSFKPNTRDLTLASLLVVLSIILSSLSLQIPLFGAMSLKIGFSQLPLMVAGSVLGPCWAFVCGIVQDILDIIVNPSGFPFFGFTLNKVLIATVPALWHATHKKEEEKTYSIILIFLAVIYALTTISIFISDMSIFENTYNIPLNNKILLLAVYTIVMVILAIITLFVKKKESEGSLDYPVANWLMSIILVECLIQLTLTPLWLQVMYSIPFYLNLLVRLCKAAFNILLNLFLGYFVLKTIARIH